MASCAPFGRDDQPLLEVKIIGGKRIEVEVDKYGRPLHEDQQKTKADGSSRFSRSLSEERSSFPPWARESTPPKKVLKPLGSPVPSEGSQHGSLGSNYFSSSPKVLPPIAQKGDKAIKAGNDAVLMKELRFGLLEFDTSKLKDAYMSFAGMDSTLTGFVHADQVEDVFRRYKIPIHGDKLDSLIKKFTSGTRPNWVNYEQMLTFINKATKPLVNTSTMYDVPKLDLDTNPGDRARDHMQTSSWEYELPLKPNQVSPRPIHDGSSTGRQSAMNVKRAFQDRQDAQLTLEMELLFKQIPLIRELIGNLYATFQDIDMHDVDEMSAEKVKSTCMQHHLPLNSSLLDKIIEKLDPRYIGKISWKAFMAFIERAVPLSSSGSSRSGYNSPIGSAAMRMPLGQPVWESRQPLQPVGKGRQKDEFLKQQKKDKDQKNAFDVQLAQQGEELVHVMNRQQRHLDNHQKALVKDHIGEIQHPEKDFYNTQQSSFGEDQDALEKRHQELLNKQFELLEQKRRMQKEQEELDRCVSEPRGDVYGGGSDRPHTFSMNEGKQERFQRLELALADLCDRDGYVEVDVASRYVKNYNLIFQLNMPEDTIQNALNTCRTSGDMVSIDSLLAELQKSV